MDINKVDMYITSNAESFPAEKIMLIREKLLEADDSRYEVIVNIKLKNPFFVLVLSVLFGKLGIDRFVLGDIGLGVLKLLTLGGLGIWWIIDIFLTYKKAKEKNYETLTQIL